MMPLDPESTSRKSFGLLQSCLVEGDPEQRAREQHVRRKALVTSVLLQASLLAGLILVPLFAKPVRLISGFVTPVPPYRQVSGRNHATPPPRGDVRHVCVTCFNSHPANLATNSRIESTNLEAPMQDAGLGDMPTISCPTCINVPTSAPRPPVELRRDRPQVLHQAHIDPAMLIHRVDPTYPTLARQIGRAGKVELQAIIATDGTIQSLHVVSGDPLFYQSALEAVRQWRYRPTVLNGEPVEIDTFITVIYHVDR
jgi:periplasmic protein TonB